MALEVRPARPGDRGAELLLESALSYYAAFAGGESRALAVLRAIFPHTAHLASFEVCLVAERDSEVVGVLSAFPAELAPRYARRFVALSARRVPPPAWPAMTRHLRAARRVSPRPPEGSWYVDGLAVAARSRRQGVAGVLLDAAERAAVAAGRDRLALVTGVENEGAQKLYEQRGFSRTGESRAPDAVTARDLGGAGFVSYLKPLGV